MSKRKTMGYEMLLLMVLALTAVMFATGESQARYANTATWNTFIQPAEAVVSSDWLQPVDRAETTILMGDLTQVQEQIVFTLESREDLSGELNYFTDQPDYLTVTCENGNVLALTKDQPMSVTLTVTLTELAQNAAREEMTAHVTVTWNNAMTGCFRLVLPAVGETQEQEMAEGETTEQPQQVVAVTVGTISHFSYKEGLPVKVTAADGVTKVLLGLTDEQAQTLQNFPAGTRYRMNGESYVLYRDGVIEAEVEQNCAEVQLDFSQVAGMEGQTLYLMAEGKEDGLLLGTAATQVTADVQTILPQQLPVLVANGTVELALPVQWKDYPLVYTVERLVLQKDEQQREQKVYVPVEDLESGALQVRLTDSESGYMLLLKTGETLPAAGTYRMNWNWNYEGMDFGENQIYFFINYMVQAIQNEQTGGAGQ